MTIKEKRIVAIDVSKNSLVVYWAGLSIAKSYSNNSEGISKLLSQIKGLNVDLVVLESTGGYENGVCEQLWANNIPLSIVNPGRVRHFCLACGYLAKTDPIDAKAIYSFGMTMELEARNQPTKELAKLKKLFLRRQQLKLMISKEKNHLSAPTADKATKSSITKHIKFMDKEVKTIDNSIADEIEKVPEIKIKANALRSQKCVGTVLTAALITLLPEIGTLNRQVIGALVGIAPYNKDSGQSERKRSIKGGRSDLRSVLYMATLSAIRSNITIKTFYRHLVSKGKNKMVALVACMRKFLIYLNTVVRKAIADSLSSTQIA
jgi:transposase